MNGLPADSISQENAIFAFKSSKFPLMIDPQGQALKWIRKTEEKSGLKTIKFSDSQFQTHLKSAISMGDPVLIPDVDEILDPIIDPVLT
jgi:dynein heavy chain, axonemal